ncbi:RagB/SusD family nutrient uptake outer membrane protein [Parafilimonas sp.]|uniref:RagB/SusD family nutrient uptake outer membrane protein n=1 Tax=Parafilimonas sp. TaxID=1969739 RepID=UPI0039E2D7ED
MKNIKTLLIIAIFFASVISPISCNKKFLDYTPQGALGQNVLATKDGLTQLLTGAYGWLYGVTSDDLTSVFLGYTSHSNWLYGSGNAVDALGAYFSVTPSNTAFDAKWRADYAGISMCNQVITVAALVTNMSDDDKTNIIAQARFLRGYYYFDLKKIFNMVPWIDETTTDANQPNNTDIWPNIEADFLFAMDNLPETQADNGRVNKWAAASFLGKTYLYEQKYDDSKTVFDDVIANGVTAGGISYDLNAQFEDNFRPEKELTSPEAIFSIAMAANVGNSNIYSANFGTMLDFPINSPFGCCGNFNPTFDLANSYRTNETTGLPYLDDYNSNALKTDFGVSSDDPFEPDEGPLDPRLDWTVGRRGIPFLDWGLHPGQNWVQNTASSGVYHNLKNVYWQATQGQYHDASSWAPGTAINVRLIAFDDVLLMAAECEAQLGNLDKAEEYVNRIRNRAANPAGWLYKYKDNASPMGGFSAEPAANYVIKPYPSGNFAGSGKDYALKAIYFERKLELGMEGHRFFDLVRWGILDSTLNIIYTYLDPLSTSIATIRLTPVLDGYYPIPQSEIDLSSVNGEAVLVQNLGYK